MRRAWPAVCFIASSAAAAACLDAVVIGEQHDSEQVQEDDAIADVSLQLQGSWQATIFGTLTRITFAPSQRPRSGALTVDCGGTTEGCNPIAWYNQVADAGKAGAPLLPVDRYRLVELRSDGSFLCVMSSTSTMDSIPLNLTLSADGEKLELRLALAIPFAATFTRE